MLTPIGEFKIKSGKVMVSDPCYDRETWCQGEIDNVKNGQWVGYTDYADPDGYGSSNTKLVAVHKSIDSLLLDKDKSLGLGFDKCSFEVGVDSGQAGIFDSETYQDDSLIEGEPDFIKRLKDMYKERPLMLEKFFQPGQRWYGACCDKTLRNDKDSVGAGVIPFGAVSSSGYGDGVYDAYTLKDRDTGETIAIQIIFIRNGKDD